MQKERYFVALPLDCREIVEKIREDIQKKSGMSVKVNHTTVIATVLRMYAKENLKEEA